MFSITKYNSTVKYLNINKNTSGVYIIKCIINNKCYVGSSSNLYMRFKQHKSKLLKQKHSNKYLQHSFNKHGNNNFIFEVLAICPNKYLIKLEQWFIDNYNSEYNIRRIAESNKDISWGKHTEESKKKIADKVRGNKNNLGKKSSIEKIEKIRKLHTGKVVSSESRHKMSIAALGKTKNFTKNHKINLSIALKGKCKSEEHKKAMSLSKRKVTDEQLLKIRELQKEGLSSRKIALVVKINRTTIQDIKNNKQKYL